MKLKYEWMWVILSTMVIVAHSNGQSNTFPSSGNVGIGTTSPGSTLDVEGGRITVGGLPALSGNGAFNGNSNDGHWIALHSSLGGADWNGIVQPGDQGLIYSGSGQGAGSFVIAP